MNPQDVNWLGQGAHPFTAVQAAPGKYYVPSKHPYMATLPGGLQVQEAYPGQYYVPHPVSGVGALPQLSYPKWLCAVVGGLAVAGVAFGAGKTFVKKHKPKFPVNKAKQIPIYWALGGLASGAMVGWLFCGGEAPGGGGTTPLPEGPPPSMPPATLVEGQNRYAPVYPLSPA